MIGLVIPDIENPFFADMTRGAEEVLSAQDYTVILSNVDENAEKQKNAIDTLLTEHVDGIIVPPTQNGDADVERLLEDGIPVVCADRRPHDVRVDTIESDNQYGAYQAVEHLIQLGHRRIGFIGSTPGISTTEDRLRGYEEAHADYDIDLDPELLREGDSRMDSGRRLTDEFLDLSHPPTALFTTNNLLTLGALVAIHDRHLGIPKDIALVGYDDMPWALALNPPITVVDQAGYEMGRRAAEMLLQRIAEPNRSPSRVQLQPKLIVRQSCGAEQEERQ
jgi:LacI family transcriptional regulator/LacI family repressor for deo operon, udp, cdd, tsx, nupC, and nupG